MLKLWSRSKQALSNCKLFLWVLKNIHIMVILNTPWNGYITFCYFSKQLDYQTVLHLSSRLGHWKLTALFCSEEIDADPNVTDIKNFTPLHYACLAGNIKDSRILLNSGANVILQNYVSKYLFTPKYFWNWQNFDW